MTEPHKPITTMSDREKLDFVAKGYNELMQLEANRRALVAKMIRACVTQINKPSPRGAYFTMAEHHKHRADVAAAWKGLDDLATMLERESVRSPDTKSTEG